MTRGILAAILLIVVAWRVWRSGMTIFDAILAILFGVAIAPGQGSISNGANWLVDHAVQFFGWLAGMFN